MSNIDLTPALFFALTGTYTLTRAVQGAIVNGRFSAPSLTTLTLTAGVQPASKNELILLPEGLRARETKKLFSATQMLTASPEANRLPDVISIDGDSWQVQWAGQWGTFANYYMALLQRVGNG